MGIRPSAKAEYSLSVIPFSHDIVFADLDRLIQNKERKKKKNFKKKNHRRLGPLTGGWAAFFRRRVLAQSGTQVRLGKN